MQLPLVAGVGQNRAVLPCREAPVVVQLTVRPSATSRIIAYASGIAANRWSPRLAAAWLSRLGSGADGIALPMPRVPA